MKLLKHLYKVAYDDVKDAEMLLEYAEDAKENGHMDIAKYFASDALNRASKQYDEIITTFHKLVEAEKVDMNKDCLGCLVCHMLEELDEWRDSVVKRLEKL